MCPPRFVPCATTTHGPCQRCCDAGDIRIGSAAGSARARGLPDEAGKHLAAHARNVLLVLEQYAERPFDRGLIELACPEGGKRHRPVERLRDTRPLEEVIAPKRLDHRDDASRKPCRDVGQSPRDDRELAVDAWIVDPL